MFRYSEDNFSGRALNWILIAGAALMIATITTASFAPRADHATKPVTVTLSTPDAAHG